MSATIKRFPWPGFETVKSEGRRYGVNITGSEIVGFAHGGPAGCCSLLRLEAAGTDFGERL